MSYVVKLDPRAEKELHAADPVIRRRLFAAIVALAGNPRPPGVKRLRGPTDMWRVRVGDWRILYNIADRELTILVLKIAHRREVYR